jgi:peptide/nickel transport system permease protein
MSLQELIWRQFLRNRLAVWSGIVLIFFYVVIIFAGFLAPYDYTLLREQYLYAPPQPLYFVDREGQFHLRPFTFRRESVFNRETFQWEFETDYETMYPVKFFVRGDPYEFLGLFPTDLHLFGVDEPGTLFLFGTDALGRDMFSRVIFGGRVSLTVGLVGVVLTILFGSVLGTVSGYFGGVVDTVIQRVAELLTSFPGIPLWAALAAALPPDWLSIKRYFAITIILSLKNWTGLARQVRAKVLSYREMEYTMAAKAVGVKNWRIIIQHMLPNAMSHIIVVATLSIPGMILSETALSFLGLGIQPPLVSWGVLLQKAQHVSVVLNHPWFMIPGAFVVVAVIAFNFLGDGLRDAADPFSV